MKAHIVGGGIAGLAAAAFLVRDGRVLGQNVTIYERGENLGGAMAADLDPKTGYVLPTGRVFEREYRCCFDLFAMIPSASDASQSVAEEIAAFNARYGYDDIARLLDGERQVVHDPHFGLSVRDRLDLLKLSLLPEALLETRRIEAFFDEGFFRSEFWYIWASLMGSLPQHGALELRRYMQRFLHILPDLSTMHGILRTRFNQQEAIVRPLAAWLGALGVRFVTGATVVDIAVDAGDRGLWASGIVYRRDGQESAVPVAPDDVVLVTNGSQVERMTTGSNDSPPPAPSGEAAALWRRLARGRPAFGNPDAFFGDTTVADTGWVTFTATTQDPTFFGKMETLTGREPGRGGLLTLRDTPWLLSVALFHQPEFIEQPDDTMVWWGYGMCPDRPGTLSGSPMTSCSGRDILRETLHHLGFDDVAGRIVESTTVIPCLLPHAGSVWLPRTRADRPAVVPDGSRNLGFIGQFCELPDDTVFTMEYSVRSAWTAVAELRRTDRPPPPTYCGLRDPAAIAAAFTVLA